MSAITHAIERAKPVTPAGVVQVDLQNLMTQDWPAARYVLEPIVPRRESTLLGGHGGIGKSMLALTLAAHVACGRKWGPFPAVQCRAAYISLEDEAPTVRYRLRRIVEAYNLPTEYIIDALTV
ncbi:MAG: AAA family ATPase, partial [Rhodanobacteraceae bacterium]